MYRELVKGNKLCYNFNELKKQNIHHKKLQTAECIVNNLNPQAYNLAIPYSNKRNQILEEKYTEIERENRILLEKITNIMHNKEKARSQSINIRVHRKTLHSGLRKKELVKITVENQQILNRIRTRKPTYDTKEILKQTSKQSEHVQRISEYSQLIPIPNPKRTALNRTTQGRYQKQGSGEIRMENQSFNDYDQNQNQRQMEKMVLYKASQIHGAQSFVVEIFFQENLFRITADDLTYQTTKILEMSQEDGQKVLQTIFQNNINLLAQALVINERIHVQGLEQFEQIDESNQEKLS